MDNSRPSDDELDRANRDLASRSPEEILTWAVRRFHPKLVMATAFGPEGCCLLAMLADIEPETKVVNLETGYQFAETLELRERIRERYRIDVELVRPDLSVVEYEKEHGGPLYVHRPDQCCFDRKVLPLRQAVKGYAAWISAIRGDQTENRRVANVVQWDAKFQLVKVNPLLNWRKQDVWKYILEHEVPYNPLHDQGYPSVGCWPCTAAVTGDADERSGRWAGTKKKECGLHVIEHEEGSGI